mgnify:CR=1 FL=1
MITIKTIDINSVENKEPLSDSSNEVYRGHLSQEAAKKMSMSESVPMFIKKSSKRQAQEEASFSMLYQMDIGEQAAKTVLLSSRQRNIGTASFGLTGFQEYWKLSTDECDYKSEVFNLDEVGKPVSIRKVSGLANLLMSAWLYAEDDFHCANFGIAKSSAGDLTWIRFDFGLSFASITHDGGRPFREVSHHFDTISLADLQQFPKLKDATPFYWPTSLGLCNHTLNFKGGVKHNTYTENDQKMFGELAQNSQFKKEKNEFLLNQFLIDTDLKTSLLTRNIDEPRGSRLAATIESRILKLRWTALAEPSFREFILALAKNEKDKERFFTNTLKNQLEIIPVSKTRTQECYQAQFKELCNLIEIIDDKKTKKEKISFNDTQLSVLKAKQKTNKSLSNKSEIEVLQRARNQELATHLADASRSLNARLSDVHIVIDRTCVLSPMDKFISHCGKTSSQGLFFTSIRNNWLEPNLQDSSQTDNADDLFNRDFLLRSRNLEQLTKELILKNLSLPLDKLLEKYLDISHQKLTSVETNLKLHDIEQDLIKLKYAHYFCGEYQFLKMPFPRSLSEQNFNDIAKVMDFSIQTLVPQFINTCYDKNALMPDIEQSVFVSDIKRINSLFSEFLNKDFFEKLYDDSLGNKVKIKFNKHLLRVNKLMKRFDLVEDPLNDFTEMSADNQQAFIQELSFILSRMALDIQGAQAKVHLEQVPKGDRKDLPHDGISITNQLIEANHQLSRAMSAPNYHDKESLSHVAEAGLLGARALKNPTFDNANACLAHVERLGKSTQARLTTKIALALTLISALTFTLSLLALFGPLALPVIGAATVFALKTTATMSALTFFGVGAYGLRRRTKDMDKAKRYIENIADVTFNNVENNMPKPRVS